MIWGRLGFRTQLFIGAVLPALMMVVLLEYVFLSRYHWEIEKALLERGRAIVLQLGVAAEYALFSGSTATLDLLATGVRQNEKDILSVRVLDRHGRRIAGDGAPVGPPLPLVDRLQIMDGAGWVVIQSPIHRAALPLPGDPWELAPEAPKEGIGYIVIEITRERLQLRHEEMLRITGMIVLGGLLLGSWLSMRIAHDVLTRLEQAQTELRQQKEKAEVLALTDTLTGLANRRAFDEALQREMRRAERYDSPLALVLIDLDYFKSINDRFGHHGGDQVLIDFARTLRTAVRDVDLVGRWGGEEFAVLLPDTAINEAHQAAERMRLAVAGRAMRLDGVAFGYTASFGVAARSAGDTVDTLLTAADAALYRAKENGRNRVEVAA